MYLADKKHNFTTSQYVDAVLMPQLKDVVSTYHCDVIWADGDWEAPDSYWRSPEFLAWAYNSAPSRDTIVTNDRWGAGTSMHHGGFYTGGDRLNPRALMQHKWEDAFTIDTTSWGFNRNSPLEWYLTIEELRRRW